MGRIYKRFRSTLALKNVADFADVNLTEAYRLAGVKRGVTDALNTALSESYGLNGRKRNALDTLGISLNETATRVVRRNNLLVLDSLSTVLNEVRVAPSTNNVTAAVVVNRTSGVAPLGVHFDATGTTTAIVTYPFHDLTYIWDYGDSTSGLFTRTTNNSQNNKIGPAIGAHVYKTPGTYIATLVARVGVPWTPNRTARVGKKIWHDGVSYQCHTQHVSGATFSATNWSVIQSGYMESVVQSITITVQDPAVVYPAAQTICVAADGVFTGMPTATTQLTTLPGVIPSHRRVVIKGGLTANYGVLQIGQTGNVAGATNIHVSSWGPGQMPYVQQVNIDSNSNNPSHPSLISVQGLDIAEHMRILCSAENVVLLNNNLTRLPPVSASRVVIGEATGYYGDPARGANYQQVYWPRYIFVCENTAEGVTDGTAPYLLANGVFDRSAVMGNYWRRADEHTFRTWMSHKLITSDNHFAGEHREVIRGCWKHQSLGPDTIADRVYLAPQPASRYLCSVDDMIGSAANIGQALCGYGPENLDNRGHQRCYDATYWRPRFTRGPNTNSCIEPFANRVSMHGAICTNGELIGHAWTTAPDDSWLGGPAHALGPYFDELEDFAY